MKNQKVQYVSGGVFQSISSPVLLIDPQTAEILDANEAACNFYGYPPKVLLQKKIVDLDAVPADEAWERIHTIGSNEITCMSVPHRLASGEVRDVEINLKHCTVKNKPVKVVTIHDLTIQKRIMHKLQKRIKELNAFYSMTSIYDEECLQLDPLCQRIIDELPRSWQYPEIACGRITINEQHFTTANFRETAWHQVAPIKINNKQVGSLEIGYLTECPPEDEGPFLKEERLLLKAVVERLGKIIKRMQVEKKLQESEERYRLLFDNMSEGFALCEVLQDRNGNAMDARILIANDSFELHTGLEPANVIGRTILEVAPQLDLKSLEPYFKVVQTGEPYSSEFFSDFFQRYIRTRVFRPQPRKFAFIFEDITDRKLAEERLIESNLALEKALRAKNEFIAVMSHELRTPLNGIMATAELLQFIASDKLSDKQLKHLANIEQSGKRLLDTVNDIIDYTQIQAGTYQLDVSPCVLTEVCEVALQKFARKAAGKGQHTQYTVKPENIHIQTDPLCLQKILDQLLENASKFTQTGGEFGIEIIAQEDMKQVNITVWDTGIGIAEENLPHLFKPFAQLDARLAREYEGTGLGLALAKGLTELIGGEVTAQSTLGKGSRFTVTLPWSEVGR